MVIERSNAPLILVVEDDGGHAELIIHSFEEAVEDFQLVSVSTLNEARTVIKQRGPALVITDYRLPDGFGSELVTDIGSNFPVILMTSQGNEQVAVDAMKAGAQDYVVKTMETFAAMPRIAGLAMREWNVALEKEKIRETVKREKKEWEQTFDAVPDLIAIIDTNQIVRRVNRAMSEYCGLEPEAMTGRKCYEIMHGLSTPPINCPHIMMMQNGCESSKEVREARLNRTFDVTVSPLHDSDGQITSCVHIARDITSRIQAEMDRNALEQQFQQTQKLESLGVLAGGIAHDFNNILTVILGHCFMLKSDTEYGFSPKAHAEHIETAATRAADLCRQMLAYAGRNQLVRASVNMEKLVDEMVKMIASAIKKNVVIELDLKQNLPEIIGDDTQIRQVVMNLIINAAEAIGEKKGTIKISLSQKNIMEQTEKDFLGSDISSDNYVLLEVCDTGCGMDDETQKRIFEPFFTTKFTGRGLGMSATLGIIRSHDGALQLDSKPGEGSTFKIYFPPQVSLPEMADNCKQPHENPVKNGRGSVLLVDDEEALRAIGSMLLASMGFSITTASNGREALELYKERCGEIDLIMLDLTMPEMGGLETYNELRKFAHDVPVVICSGCALEEVFDITAHDKYAALIQKPYQSDQLWDVITRFQPGNKYA